MNTKLLMMLSAIIMGSAGIFLLFAPHEILNYLNSTTGTTVDAILLQTLGALYFAFAMMNWTAKANLIGGIYARPISIGNLTHFSIGALVFIKGYISSFEMVILSGSILYSIFAVAFAIVFFYASGKNTEPSTGNGLIAPQCLVLE